MLRRGRQFARFAVAGAVGLVADVAALYAAIHLGCGYYFGRTLSFLFAVWVTWYINRRITFRPDKRMGMWREWWLYLCAMLPGGGANYLCYSLIVALLPERAYLPALAVAVGSVAGLVVNFVMAKRWVYGTRPGDSPG